MLFFRRNSAQNRLRVIAALLSGGLTSLIACHGTDDPATLNPSSQDGGLLTPVTPIEPTQPLPIPTSTVQPVPTTTPSPTPSPTPSVSPSPIPTDSLYIGPSSLQPYVVKFVEDAQIQGLDVLPEMKNPTLQVQIASLSAYGSSVIGLCETGTGQRRVTFDPNYWNSVSDTQREILAHHELGHCVLYRAHRNNVLSSGAYASIMYPIILTSSTYLANYAYYQNELFTWNAAQAPQNGSSVVHICNGEDL